MASDALAIRKYFKKNTIEPNNIYTRIHQSEKSKKFVYTFQASFETEQEAKMFEKFNNVINIALFED